MQGLTDPMRSAFTQLGPPARKNVMMDQTVFPFIQANIRGQSGLQATMNIITLERFSSQQAFPGDGIYD